MRYMIIVKATAQSEAETTPAPDEALLAAMAAYHEELARAGVRFRDVTHLQYLGPAECLKDDGAAHEARRNAPSSSAR